MYMLYSSTSGGCHSEAEHLAIFEAAVAALQGQQDEAAHSYALELCAMVSATSPPFHRKQGHSPHHSDSPLREAHIAGLPFVPLCPNANKLSAA